MNKPAIEWKQLVYYLSGEQSSEEQRKVREWMDSDPEHEQFVYFLEKICNTSAEEKEEWDVDAAWSRYKALYKESLDTDKEYHAAKPYSIKLNRTQARSYISWLYRLGGMAAIIAITILIVFLTYEPKQEFQEPPPSREIVTKYGQRTHLRLSDGSLVIINAGSKFKVPEVFPDSIRRVQLSGEAYFEVTPDSNRPFIVYTGNTVTRVLGTKFGIRAYNEDDRVAVVVVEGKVALRSTAAPGDPGRQITKNQIGIVTETGSPAISDVKDVAPYLGWTKGNLVFAHDSLGQVITGLERWYDIDIKLKDSALAGRNFTGRFTARQPLTEVLDAIALSMGLKYERRASTIYFNTKNQQ